MQRLRIFLSIFLLIAAFGVSAQDNDLRRVTFFMTFVPNIQFAPVYVAIEQGYFAEAGIEVVIEHGDEPDGVNLIAADQRQFGLISGEQVVAARANGRPVVMVYQWFQQFPVALVATSDANIAAPADLAGERIGAPGPFGATYSGLIALLDSAGLTERDITLESIGFNAPQVVCAGAIQIAAVYANNEPLQIQDRIDAGDCGSVTGITVLPVADYANIVSNGIMTSESVIANEPELVVALVGAFDRGLIDVINNPAAAYLLSETAAGYTIADDLRAALERAAAAQATFITDNPDADRATFIAYRAGLVDALIADGSPADELLNFRVLLSTIDLWDADQLGVGNLADWETTQRTLIDLGVLSLGLADVSAAFTNEFVP